ncbi:MAG: hypothetical protein R6U46_06115 [Marinilabilia sp.]
MNQPENTVRQHYKERIEELNAQINRLHRSFKLIFPARLLTFVAFVVTGLWIIKSGYDDLFIWLSVLFFVLFLLSVRYDLKLKKKQKMLHARLKVNEDELKYLDHQYGQFEDGREFTSLEPGLTGDFDLFGPGSLFQYLNRSVTRPGKEAFARGLCRWEKNNKIIEARQEAVSDLSQLPRFIEDFRSLGLVSAMKKDEVSKLKEWLDASDPKVRLMKIAGMVWPVFFIAWVGFVIAGVFGVNSLLVPVFGPFFIAGMKRRTMKWAHHRLGRSAGILKKYSGLISLIAHQPFRSSFLKEKQSSFTGGKSDAGEALKNLFGLLEKFDYRLNLIMGTLLNILFLFDFHILVALEKWKTQHREEVPAWFDALAEFDALTGYATFAFNNRGRLVFPKLQTGDFTLDAKGVGHPLLTARECVPNDVSFAGQPKVLVITGANMAGKSTFLRTLAVNLILGMNGAPVCAEELRFTPCDIRSSINIRDSLVRHESYFYAELQRLQRIAEHVESHPPTLVILDEILRGTNSKDKHHGSMGFLEKLIRLGAVVVVATHDLEIGSLETKYPDVATNYCFEVELEGNQLTFDYQLKPGISQKLNASFLMREMGLFD